MAFNQPPPTYADPILIDESVPPGKPGREKFNPIWLKWFIDLTAAVSGSGGGDVLASGTLTNNEVILGAGVKTIKASGTTMPGTGTSGGVLGYTAAGVLASSAMLKQYALMVGGGAGATPTALASTGTSTQVLHGNASGVPTWAALNLETDTTSSIYVFARLSAGNSAAANTTAMNTAIAQINANGGGILVMPPGAFSINAGLDMIVKACIVQGSGMGEEYNYSVAGGTTLTVAGAGTLFSASAPVDFRDFKVYGGSIAIAMWSSAGFATTNLMLENQDVGIDIYDCQGYDLEGCFISANVACVRIDATAPADGGDTTISGNLLFCNGGKTIWWKAGGGLRICNNKILAGSSGIGIYLDAKAAVNTSDILIEGNSIEGDTMTYSTYITSSGGLLSNINIVGNQYAFAANAFVAIASANINYVNISANLFAAGASGIGYIVLAAGNLVTISGNQFLGGGGSPTAISIGASATNTMVGFNGYYGFGNNTVVSGNATTLIKGFPDQAVATLPACADGSAVYATNAKNAGDAGYAAGAPVSGGTGAFAYRRNGAWRVND